MLALLCFYPRDSFRYCVFDLRRGGRWKRHCLCDNRGMRNVITLVSFLNMRIAIGIDDSVNLGLPGGWPPSCFQASGLSRFQLDNDIPAFNLEGLRVPRVAFIKVNPQVFVHRRGSITNVFHLNPDHDFFAFNGCRIGKGDAIRTDAKIGELRHCMSRKHPDDSDKNSNAAKAVSNHDNCLLLAIRHSQNGERRRTRPTEIHRDSWGITVASILPKQKKAAESDSQTTAVPLESIYSLRR